MGSHSSTLAAAHTTTVAVPAVTSTLRLTASSILPSTLTVTAVSIETLTPTVASVAPLANTESILISVTTSVITATIFTEPSPVATTAVTSAVSTQAISSSSSSSSSGASVQASEPNGLAAGKSSSSVLTSAGSRTSLLQSENAGATAAAALASSSPTLMAAQIETMKRVGRGPFAPPDAILGGIPTTKLDVPISAVFLVLFLIGAATHMTIYNMNSKRGHKFILSDLFFDFCMVRTVTTTMRIVWAFKPANNSVVLAAEIFENAGVSVIFAINLVLTQRILRAIHPKIFWHPAVSLFFTFLVASVPFFIIFNIAVLTASFFVVTAEGAKITKDLLFLGASWNLFLCVFPLITLSTFAVFPSPTPIEKFGIGRFRTKIVMLVYSAATLFIGAIVRLIAAAQSHPINMPGQVDTKPIFYLTGFMLEIFVVVLFAAARFDLRFHIPNGCTGPGQYSAPKDDDKEELFQDVDVKMRISYGSAREFSQTNNNANYNGNNGYYGNINGLPISPRRWQDVAPDRTNATREQVRQAIDDLRLNFELVGHPIDSGDSELLVYAFRVRKRSVSSGSEEMEMGMGPRRPPRSSTWMGQKRSPVGAEDEML